jgi:hypothetical protein
MNVQYRKIKAMSCIKEYCLIDCMVLFLTPPFSTLCFLNMPIGYCNTEAVAHTNVENFQ